MKKSILLSLCAMASLSAMAQNSGFVELQPVISTESGIKPDLQLNFGFLHNIDDQLKLGMGLGVSEYSTFEYDPMMPVFVRGEFDFIDYGDYRPYLGVDLGYMVNFNDFESGKVYINPTLGVNLYSCYLGVGYYGGMMTMEEAVWTNAINVRLGYRFGGDHGGSLHMPSGLKRFFKHTTFGLHGFYGVGIGDAVGTSRYDNSKYEYTYSDLSRYGYGFTWLYDFNDHWAFGFGATYIPENSCDYQYVHYYNDQVQSGWAYSYDEEDLHLFLRLKYTMNQISDLPIKPFATVDFGYCCEGLNHTNELFETQVGVKLWDFLNVGVSYSLENEFGDSDGFHGLNFVLGVDL